jgi:predicted ATPase/class 3 adenylate cyclase
MSNLASYQLAERIHEGRRHDVLRGTAPDGRPVVLKILRQLHPTPAQVARFRHEFDTLASVRSEHVVTARAFETDRRRWALILDDFGGGDLSGQLDDESIDLAGRLRVAIAVASALRDLHGQGVIHKDVNPSNVVRNPATGEVRLIDFGLATALSSESPAFHNRSRLEGTLPYLSPEQTGRVAARVDYRSDLYSLGATLYELFCGRPPFSSDDPLELVHAHIARRPVPPHEVAPSVPRPLSDIIMRLLAKQVDGRYRSTHGLVADLERCLERLGDDGTIEPFEPGQDDVSIRLLIPPRLYGRDAAIAALVAALERTGGDGERSGTGSAAGVLVTGAAGVGKTALVRELFGPLTERRGYFIAGKFEQFRSRPFSGVVSAFRTLVTELLGEGEERLARLRNDLVAALGPNGRVIADVIPQIELIVGGQPPVERLGPAETRSRFDAVFRRFVGVFATPGHPVVLFLDDLQWADAASLGLMRGLLTDPGQALLILGAYRDGEVGSTHPLTSTLTRLQDEGVTLPRIALEPLELEDVTRLVADTTDRSDPGVGELAELVLRNTEGNPLFVREYLKALAADGLVALDPDSRRWTWDLSAIGATGFTQSVLELLGARLERQDEPTREVLRVAACAGATFDLKTIADVRGQTVAQVWQLLLPALQDGVLVAASELEALGSDRSAPGRRCSFFHDRIQQAAYGSMPWDERTRTHLAIGRRLLANAPPDARGGLLFEILAQLNRGRRLINDADERLRLAELNLQAGRRAAGSAASRSALEYFDVGLELLPEAAWQAHHELTLGLRRGAGEAAHAVGELARSARLIDDCIAHARTDLEAADLYVLLVKQRTTAGAYADAIEAARTGLALLDFQLPADGYMDAMMASFGALQARLGDRSPSSLLDRPQMTDELAIARCRMLSWSMAPAFYIDPLLYSVISFESMKLLVEHGNPRDAVAIYAQYGHLLGALFGDPVRGYEFTVLSRELCDRQGNLADKTEACFLSGNFSHCWVRPMQEARAILEEGLQAGLQSGALQFARYNLAYLGFNDLWLGAPLAGVLRETEEHRALCIRQQDKIARDAVQSVRHVANNLAGGTASATDFACDGLDEAALVEGSDQAAMVVCYFQVFKCAALTVHRQHEAALAASQAATERIASIPGNISVGRLAFYTGLSIAALLPGLEEEERAARLGQLRTIVDQLAGYAVHCEANWAHTHALVAAELARVEGEGAAAFEGYERAIALADAHRWPADHALACELAGRHWRGQGRDELSSGYLRQARYGYEQWGALRKVAMLDEELPGLAQDPKATLSSTTMRTVSVTHTESDIDALDLASVIRASQAISGEIKLERLLGRLLELLLESAGAQHGVLVVADEGDLAVRADATLEPDGEGGRALRTDVDLNRSLGSYDAVSAPVVHYAARTGETVLLDDATLHGRFTRDPYVVRVAPRSVLCLPLRNKGDLVGVLYLENREVAGAFTADRLELVNLLASQFAISFENARLYNEMEGKVAARTEQLAHKNVELEQTLNDLRIAQSSLVARNEFIRSVFGRYVSDDVVEHLLEVPEALELGGERRPITVLASDVRGFTALAERLDAADVLTLLNRYFEAMFEVIHRHGGTVNAILGDGLFVFFGAPIPQEDAARRAVACALGMMRALDRLKSSGEIGLSTLEMGIGINTGSAVVGNIGSQDRTKYSAIGLDVNLAARIESCTVGGQILISESTAAATRPDVVLSGSMEFSAKGVARPLTLHEVEGLTGPGASSYRRARGPSRTLATPIAARFGVVSGGVVAPTLHEGSIVRLSFEECELVTEAAMAPLTNLKIELFDREGRRVEGDVYGKVLAGSAGTRLGFTSVPPEVRAWLGGRLALDRFAR